jgi:hypothetical protein
MNPNFNIQEIVNKEPKVISKYLSKKKKLSQNKNIIYIGLIVT